MLSTAILRLDYATMNFEAGSVSAESISNSLVGDPALMCWRSLGRYDDAPLYSPLGLRYVNNNGYAARPHKLEVSGVGCRKFLYTLPSLRSDRMHFSRLDFAFDVIMSRSDWRVFLGECFISSMNSDRDRKRYRLSGDGEAMTVYIGSRKSAKFFRIYNKTLEDAKYEYRDGNGAVVPLDDSECVIRYEVELHRWKSIGKQGERIFDPSPCFDWYYSSDPSDHARLHDEIRRMWLSFGNEVLLPPGFDKLQFVDLTSGIDGKHKFCSENSQELLEQTKASLHDFPHSFDHTLSYVTSKFGKYIPYILADQTYRDFCFASCAQHFGFAPDYYFEQTEPAGFRDMDDLDDVCDDIPESWYQADEEDQLLINKDFERRHNQWS